jgi:endonuclease/exonuclease/phosphatase (EEP) superfamily protein YafD
MLWSLLVAAALLAASTLVPLIRSEALWVRAFDFPRLQIAALSAVVLAVLLLFGGPGALFWIALALIVVAIAGQALVILPYTPIWKNETVDAVGGHPTLRILVANVMMSNRDSEGLLRFIRDEAPDLVVFDEPDAWWCETLRVLGERYPHRLEDPRDNTYGMIVYSTRPFERAEHRAILDPEVPSFHVCLDVHGTRVTLHLIHPPPPYPKYASTTLERDAELLVVGRLCGREQGPVIVAGDLNDVAWSHTTRLFQRISGLLDPRRGRGMYNTFHAGHWFMRWPLDHLFHSRHFRLVRIVRGPAYGSDHFPILIELELDSGAQDEHAPPALDHAHAVEAEEKIGDARREEG